MMKPQHAKEKENLKGSKKKIKLPTKEELFLTVDIFSGYLNLEKHFYKLSLEGT